MIGNSYWFSKVFNKRFLSLIFFGRLEFFEFRIQIASTTKDADIEASNILTTTKDVRVYKDEKIPVNFLDEFHFYKKLNSSDWTNSLRHVDKETMQNL